MLTIADHAWFKFKSVYLRVTLTRFTLAFFIFSFVHCFAQGIIQSFLYQVDAGASSLVSDIIDQANVTQREFTWLTYNNGVYNLKLCTHIPGASDSDEPCATLFESGMTNITSLPSGFSEDIVSDAPIETLAYPSSGMAILGHNSSGVTVTIDNGNDVVLLDQQCTRVLMYPDQVLLNSKREDLALIGSQFWLFSISLLGLVYNSIPHILAILLTRVLATGWSAYSIWRTKDIEQRFQNLIVNSDTPCHVQLFPTYFKTRSAFEIPDLVLNCTALVLSAYLVFKLVKDYSKNTFKRVGPPPAIIRIHRFFLAILVCLQLLVYFLVTAMGLWVDQLFNGDIAKISSHTAIYIALFLFTMIVLLPWIVMGWYSIRLEKKRTMAAFLLIAGIFVTCWAIMFYSLVYRWTFIQWPFFACMTVASFIVLVATGVLGVICWLNFDKGLAHYLYVEGVLADSDFAPEVFPHDIEKCSFHGY